MQRLSQSPTDPDFVQDPYPFYDRARASGPLFYWEDYGLIAAPGHAEVGAILRDRRMGRAPPPGAAWPPRPGLAAFEAVEAHSMLELEPPAHTRLRKLVLSAFTSRAVAALEPGIAALCDRLIDGLPAGPFDLVEAYAAPIPVTVIARLLGVPEHMAPQLLAWSHDMVAMYQARRDAASEAAAERAAREFSACLRGIFAERRARPGEALIDRLIAARVDGERLSEDELVSTAILLLNAGHEATVHAIGNAARALIGHGRAAEATAPGRAEAAVEEALRHDPPLHLFTRYVYEDVELFGHRLPAGAQIACLLGAAGRDPALCPQPHRFDPARPAVPHHAFGAGIHFCVGAPLARLEMRVALARLFARLPGLTLAEPPRYADIYHFHGHARLMVQP